jgi:hypothetical protein
MVRYFNLALFYLLTINLNYSQEIVNLEINQLHLSKFRWLENQQKDSLAMLLHDEVKYIHSNGWIENKEEVLQNISTEKLKYHKVNVLESEVIQYSPCSAVVTGKGLFQVSLEGRKIEIKLLYSEHYIVDEEGKIKLVHRHACKIE